jgi:hypothetical protein
MIENPGTGRTSRAYRFWLTPLFFGLRLVLWLTPVHLPPAPTRSPWLCSNPASTVLDQNQLIKSDLIKIKMIEPSIASPDQQKSANDIGEITCLSIPKSQAVS